MQEKLNTINNMTISTTPTININSTTNTGLIIQVKINLI